MANVLKRLVLLEVCLSLAFAVSANADTRLHGRAIRVQAALDAELVQSTEPVHVFTRQCTRPSRLRGCSPMSDRMRSALEDAITAPIIWVDRKVVGGSLFLAFAPVEFTQHEAMTEVAEFWRAGSSRCAGGFEFTYRSRHGEWRLYLGIGWASCSAAI